MIGGEAVSDKTIIVENNKLRLRISELEAEVASLTADCRAWEEKYWEAQERYEDPSLSDREAMIYGE
jgi:hypothetical protein